jgi:hypothetical protein
VTQAGQKPVITNNECPLSVMGSYPNFGIYGGKMSLKGLVCILMTLCISDTGLAAEQQWDYVGASMNFEEYYGPDTVERLSGGAVDVWIKRVLNENGVAGYVNKIGPSYRNISMALDRLRINCTTRGICLSQIRHYTKSGDLMYLAAIRCRDQDYFRPNALSEKLMNKVCSD